MMIKVPHYFRYPLILLLAMGSHVLFANERIPVGEFSKGQFSTWEAKVFSGKTSYRIIQEGQHKVLKAHSKQSASGLGRRIKVDLTKTPFLNWRWKIDKSLKGLQEQTKAGDDYAARVYVIVDGGFFPWNTKALNYVWSSNQDRGTHWNNAYLPKNAKMKAVRGQQDKVGIWQQEKHNVRADFKHIYGIDLKQIDGVAIMTDTDNSKGEVSAAYGDIYFTAK